MAEGTRLSIDLNAEDLVDGLDKAAAKFESFSKRAQESIDTVSSHAGDMSEAQKRAFNVIKKSYDNHAKAIQDLINEYESLREKQKSGEVLTKSECARLQQLTGEFKKHNGAINASVIELGRLGKEHACLLKNTQDTVSGIRIFENAIGGLGAIGFSKLIDSAGEAISKITNLGLQTQQIVSQMAAMGDKAADGAVAYQAFNDVARNTNYDFTAVYNMGKQLMNMGYSAKNAADLIQLCADTSAGLGQDVSGAQRLVEAISRIQATGRVTREQLASLQMAGLDLDKAFAPLGLDAQTAMQQV